MDNYENKLIKVPKRTKPSAVYDTHLAANKKIFEEFFKTSYIENEVANYELPTRRPKKMPVPIRVYKDLQICGLPVEEVGCGIICTAQGLTSGVEPPTRECFEQIIDAIQKNDYYYVGRGLYWHWFDNFCSRLYHWYDIVRAIECGYLVTVLIKRDGDSRNHFTNLVGTKNKNGLVSKVVTGNDYFFITSDNEEYTIPELMGMIVTLPWKWD